MKKVKNIPGKPAVFAVAEELEVPPPCGENAVVLSQTNGLTVCNVTDIPACSSECIVLRMRRSALQIDGQGLFIEKYEGDTVTVHGTLLSFSFVQGGAFVC